MKDNWKNRGSSMKCLNCMWFVAKIPEGVEFQEDNPLDKNSDKPLVGRCRRHAPTNDGYPVVFDNDFCGDHRLDENMVI